MTDEWLTTYTEANPKRAMYAFCIDPKHPSFFFLCYKNGQQGPLQNMFVKVIPNAFQLNKSVYPDMRSLKNGFKQQMMNMQQRGRL